MFQIMDKLLERQFAEIVIELLLKMYDPPSEGSDASRFMRYVIHFHSFFFFQHRPCCCKSIIHRVI